MGNTKSIVRGSDGKEYYILKPYIGDGNIKPIIRQALSDMDGLRFGRLSGVITSNDIDKMLPRKYHEQAEDESDDINTDHDFW